MRVGADGPPVLDYAVVPAEVTRTTAPADRTKSGCRRVPRPTPGGGEMFPSVTAGSSVTMSRYHPRSDARTLSWARALGADTDRCVAAVREMGPVQSCGAMALPGAAAREAIFMVDVIPPHQVRQR